MFDLFLPLLKVSWHCPHVKADTFGSYPWSSRCHHVAIEFVIGGQEKSFVSVHVSVFLGSFYEGLILLLLLLLLLLVISSLLMYFTVALFVTINPPCFFCFFFVFLFFLILLSAV